MEPEWIVNSNGELGVKVDGRFYFLYKGDSLEYAGGSDGIVHHDDGPPMMYRMVGKREFGEVCYPAKFLLRGVAPQRPYTEELAWHPGLSFGKKEDADWRPLPAKPEVRMTKLMFCGACGDMVAPGQVDMRARWCHCGRHAVWWRDGRRGLLSVHDRLFPERNGGAGGKAWVIGLHNMLTMMGGSTADPNSRWCTPNEVGDPPTDGNLLTRKKWVEQALEDTPDTYLFKRVNSLVIRIAPGYSGDTRWDAVVPANAG